MGGCDKCAGDLDLVERDPTPLNDHIKIAFHEVFGELKENARSVDCVWQGAYCCFNGVVCCCYNCFTVFCAIPIAFCWACEFACLAFNHIWCSTPCYRYIEMCVVPIRRIISLKLSVCCVPCCETIGHVFSKIVVTAQSNVQDLQQKAY